MVVLKKKAEGKKQAKSPINKGFRVVLTIVENFFI